LGCHPDQFDRGDHLLCKEKSTPFTKYMHWTTHAVRDGRWSITAGPESAPVSSYKPGERVELHVRMLNYWNAHSYRGIMLHFQQSSDPNTAGNFAAHNRSNANGLWNPTVGEWQVVRHAPRMFHSALNSACGKGVLFHATAQYKNSHEVFWFKAPPAGTGPIALRALIKLGDADSGDFYFPMTGGDLILAEDAAIGTKIGPWVRGGLGQSCRQVCSGLPACDEDALRTGLVNAADVKYKIVDQRVVTCDAPLLSNCGPLGPTTSSTEYCYAYDPAACAGRHGVLPTCAASSVDRRIGYRLCPCGNDVTTPPTTGATTATTGNLTATFGASTGSTGASSVRSPSPASLMETAGSESDGAVVAGIVVIGVCVLLGAASVLWVKWRDHISSSSSGAVSTSDTTTSSTG
jgi:hypothetical protein